MVLFLSVTVKLLHTYEIHQHIEVYTSSHMLQQSIASLCSVKTCYTNIFFITCLDSTVMR